MDNVPLKDGTTINNTSVISTKWSKILLSCGVIAGPLYIGMGLIQMLTRKGLAGLAGTASPGWIRGWIDRGRNLRT
jgi:hypothetical protein